LLGPAETKSWSYQAGYANLDKITNIADVHSVSCFYGGNLKTSQEENFQKYYDLCDVDPNSLINTAEVYVVYLYT
jgi:hypothetical protein